jgi:1,4-alpha-glucan branching enzyme
MTPLLERKRTHFVLWRPAVVDPPPRLVIGVYRDGSPPSLEGERSIALAPSPISGVEPRDVWEIDVGQCDLIDGRVYHYWFEVGEANGYHPSRGRVRIADPAAFAVDWRLLAPASAGDRPLDRAPASIIRLLNGELVPADPVEQFLTFDVERDVAMSSLPPNNRLVVYELPTAWSRAGDSPSTERVAIGTFRDVLALVDASVEPPGFRSIPALRCDPSYLVDLGVNALELLPPADSYQDRSKWGYGTTNYFAPDFDLGRPGGADAPSSVGDFLKLVRACHRHGIRFIVDVVLAYAELDPYSRANFADFHVKFVSPKDGPPVDPEQSDRDGFGGDLWKYAYAVRGYDPSSGLVGPFYPARAHMLTSMLHWMRLYHVDGYRLDSLNNVRNYDFIGQFRDSARAAWRARWQREEPAADGADARFLVVGEELNMPRGLLAFVDGLWNESFRNRVRNAIVGRNGSGQPSFEWTIRELIDCRHLGFSDGSQAVNYLGSHDVANRDPDGTNNDRIMSYLERSGIADMERRLKLAFVCLLTAVGIPMIFAGDEFGSPSPAVSAGSNLDDGKQAAPLDFTLREDPWRARLFRYVRALVRLRTSAAALSVNDTAFLHFDFDDGRRVAVWQRGGVGQDPVIVVANFSDWGSDVSRADAEYRIPSWPEAPPGRSWIEVTSNRRVPDEWIGREPIYPWEAKVYALT